MTIAITGATGQLGRLAIAALKTRAPGADIVALVRNPDRAGDLGVPVRLADYSRPETLGPALAGVETLVLISSNDFSDRLAHHRNVIAAARTAGVRRLVYTSILKGDASTLKLAADHVATEQAIRESGLAATILRNGWYTENYTGALKGAVQAGAVIGAAGTGALSTAARGDYAEAIAAVATSEGHHGKVYELAGDTAYTLADLAAEVSRQTGTAIPYNNFDEATYAGILTGFGLPEGFAAALADSDVQAGKGGLYDGSRTLSRLIGRPTTTLAASVRAALA